MHHSGQQHGEGGLVRHTKAVVYMARRLAKAYALDEEGTDFVIAGALLHDIGKPLEKKNGGDSPLIHDEIGGSIVYEAGYAMSSLFTHRMEHIVRSHMGVWGTTPQEIPTMKICAQVVHLADYTVSQKGLSFDNLDNINAVTPGSLG